MQLTLILKDNFRGNELIASIMVTLEQVLAAKNPEFLKTLVLKLKRDIEKEMYSVEANR